MPFQGSPSRRRFMIPLCLRADSPQTQRDHESHPFGRGLNAISGLIVRRHDDTRLTKAVRLLSPPTSQTAAMRRPQESRPSAPRATAAAAIALTALALLAAACSDRPSSVGPSSAGHPSATGTAASSAVAFSRCMRSRGVPTYPDPTSSGALPKTSPQQLGVSSSQFQSAQAACQHLIPDTGLSQQTQQCMLTGNCPQALVQQILTAERKFARCMRAHGVPNWPDPSIDSEGRPVFLVSRAGVDAHAPQIRAKSDVCDRLTGGAPVPLE
jgi:hypothetical protein